MGHFCPPGSGSGFQPDPDPKHWSAETLVTPRWPGPAGNERKREEYWNLNCESNIYLHGIVRTVILASYHQCYGSGSASTYRWRAKMYGKWAYLSTFSRFWEIKLGFGSISASKWKVGSGSGSASKWQAEEDPHQWYGTQHCRPT